MYEGSEVSIYYDPMISKFAVYGKDRNQAIERMGRALREYQIGGIKTTLPFFREVLNDPEFVAGKLDTGFITGFFKRQATNETDQTESDLAVIAAALGSEQGSTPAPISYTSNRPSNWVMATRNK